MCCGCWVNHLLGRKVSVLIGLLAAAWITAVAGLAWADGDARLATPPEKAFVLNVLTTLDKALPPGPAGWDQTDRTKLEAPKYLSLGAEKEPLRAEYRVAWQDTQRLRAAGEKAVKAGMKVMQRQQADTNNQALQKRFEALANKLGEALQKNDYAQAKLIQAEMESVGKKLEASYAVYDKEMNQKLADQEARDAKAKIAVMVNWLSIGISKDYKASNKIEGLASLRSPGEQTTQYGWREGETLVLLGQWSRDNNNNMQAKVNPALPSTVVQAIVVRVQADQARAEKLLKAINWKMIKGLMAKRP